MCADRWVNPEAGASSANAWSEGCSGGRCVGEGNLWGRVRASWLDGAEVKGHTCDAERDMVSGCAAAELLGGGQGTGMHHSESFSSLSERMARRAGAMIIARKTKARTRSWTIVGGLLQGRHSCRLRSNHAPGTSEGTYHFSRGGMTRRWYGGRRRIRLKAISALRMGKYGKPDGRFLPVGGEVWEPGLVWES